MAFRKQTGRKQYCSVGSVKANIGHPEQAAGIAGLIKTALVASSQANPAEHQFSNAEPCDRLRIVALLRQHEAAGFSRYRYAAAGRGKQPGDRRHECFRGPRGDTADRAAKGNYAEHVPCLITLSAKSADALVARVEQFLNWLNDNPGAPIGDVCYTTNVSRSQFDFRYAASAQSEAQLKNHITSWLRTAAH